MFDPHLPPLMGAPAYRDPALYLRIGDRLIPWEYEGWERESLSWKTGCYIHAGLSNQQVHFTGPQALEFLSGACVNGLSKFPVGSMRHAVFCTDAGLVAQHAILQRNGPEEYKLFARGLPWSQFQAARSGLDVTVTQVPGFLFQIAGPTSLATLEAATGESLRDIGFLKFRHAKVAGIEVEVARIGMSGNLAYELRGPLDLGPQVYAAVMAAGAPLGIQRLGWRTYFVNHIEGGFPQMGWTFFTGGLIDRDFSAALPPHQRPRITGSVDPADLRARLRTPHEVGWEKTVKFDHDFTGRAAIEAEAANPRRTVATLRWNAEDVLDVHASLLRPGEPYRTIDMPVTPSWQHGFFAHADRILAGGRDVGVSSGTIYSRHFREVISMATIDIEMAHPGAEVTVLWGNHGGPIKEIRATVARFPYLQEGRNSEVDARTV